MGCKVKKVLIIDDSALMRRVVCDIIAQDEGFEVADMAADGEAGLNLIMQNTYDVVVLDIVMPKLDGIGVLKRLQEMPDAPSVVMFSSEGGDGTQITIQALELGAFEFIKKPSSILGGREEQFVKRFLSVLLLAVQAGERRKACRQCKATLPSVRRSEMKSGAKGTKVVAIACSTGGPKALQKVIPALPANLDAPVLVVQHMPAGFTASLAQRLDEMSPLHVQEAQDGMEVAPGNVYIARGGIHMEVAQRGLQKFISLKDGPTREGVRPCANFMYESLAETDYALCVCVILTGMGSDGTKGIQNLKPKKQVYTIAQDEESSVVYGMPRSASAAGIVDQQEPIDKVAQAIISNVGVK